MVKVTELVKVFQDGRARVSACDRISFEVPAGTFFTLLGPSGCGKTTTLRSIAGLERPDRARRGDRVRLTFHPERCVAVRPEGDAPPQREPGLGQPGSAGREPAP